MEVLPWLLLVALIAAGAFWLGGDRAARRYEVVADSARAQRSLDSAVYAHFSDSVTASIAEREARISALQQDSTTLQQQETRAHTKRQADSLALVDALAGVEAAQTAADSLPALRAALGASLALSAAQVDELAVVRTDRDRLRTIGVEQSALIGTMRIQRVADSGQIVKLRQVVVHVDTVTVHKGSRGILGIPCVAGAGATGGKGYAIGVTVACGSPIGW